MLEPILGNKSRELILQYVNCFELGYAREISKYLDLSLPSVQNQLNKFEEGGVMLSRMSGRTKEFFFNPRYAFLNELLSLLNKAKEFYKPVLKTKFEMQRKRPRRPGKPL
ncbi:MAG: winged helix-turn-helix transcriptional regulator [Alcanivoracaceae bacterium]|nr:winged helix-turn-helix transcriptional regulator [Alcanivoracaceae bacterium]